LQKEALENVVKFFITLEDQIPKNLPKKLDTFVAEIP
jgi:hypothetical protein